jgi:hypothetical protein
LPSRVSGSGSDNNLAAYSRVSQFPARGPSLLAPGTLAMPAASSGARSPLSAASAASWTLTAEAESPRASSSAR